MPHTSEIANFGTSVSSMRKYIASVMAADKIFSEIRTLKTRASRNDSYRACPCLLACYVSLLLVRLCFYVSHIGLSCFSCVFHVLYL